MTNTAENKINPVDDVPDLKDPMFYCDDNTSSLITILSGFSIMLQTYVKEISQYIENVTPNLKESVIISGLDLVKNVYTETLLYTRNTLVACQTTRHATSLYFEFVSQITDGQFKHIQLSIRDTVLFVYKQTIFRIHDDKKSSFVTSQQENNHHSCLVKYTQLLLSICDDSIHTYGISEREMTALSTRLNTFDEQISTVFVYESTISETELVGMMKSICDVCECLLRKHIKQDDTLDILTQLIVFFKYKIIRGFELHDVFERIENNCKLTRLLNTEIINDDITTEKILMELIHIS